MQLYIEQGEARGRDCLPQRAAHEAGVRKAPRTVEFR
jgi:hypothetical protein